MVSTKCLEHGTNVLLIMSPPSVSTITNQTTPSSYRQISNMTYIILYVDDIIFITYTHALPKSIMSLLTFEFAMKDLDPLSYFLGIDVSHHPSGIFLSQSTYASEIIECGGMASYKPSATHVDTKQKLSTLCDTPFMDPSLCRSLVEALQYLTFTRPNISYVIQQVCLHMHAPHTEYMLALKRIMRYVQGTIQFVLHLSPPTSHIVSHTLALIGVDVQTQTLHIRLLCFFR